MNESEDKKMRNKMRFLTAIMYLMVMGLTACASGSSGSLDGLGERAPVTIIIDNAAQNGSQEQNDADAGDTQESSLGGQQEGQGQTVLDSDEELEEKLAVYRQVREDTEPISLGNGVTMGGSVDPDKYGLLFDTSIFEILDTREMMEAIDTANSYVENTLGITVETRYITYMCVDPRIWEIYTAEDKGVADGYEPENIYLREYYDNDNETWQYLILVRDGKGSAWEVIHHGSSYMEEE